MNNSKTEDFYFGISDSKIYICYFDNKNYELKNTINFDIPGSIDNNLNFKIISNLLKENIRKLEKDLGLFLNSGNISIKSNSYQNISFSVKDIYDEIMSWNEQDFVKPHDTSFVQWLVRKCFCVDRKEKSGHIAIEESIALSST